MSTSVLKQQVNPLPAGLDVVKVLGSVLEQVVSRNDKLPTNPENMTIFHAFKPPAIAVQPYLERILKYVNCSHESYVFALVYMDRIIQRNPDFFICSLNIHRVLITSVMIAAKFYDDVYYNNSFYARVGGVSVKELNNLEVEFLFMINFSLYISAEEYERYRLELTSHSVQLSSSSSKQQAPASTIGNPH